MDYKRTATVLVKTMVVVHVSRFHMEQIGSASGSNIEAAVLVVQQIYFSSGNLNWSLIFALHH